MAALSSPRHKGMSSTLGADSSPPSISRDHLLALGAEAGDGEADDVVGAEVGRRRVPVPVITRMPRAGS